MILPLILGFLLGAAAILFALQNTAVVALSFLGWQFESSLALLILMAFAMGVTVSLLVSIPSAVKDSLRIMGLKKENKVLTEKLTKEQNTPTTVVQHIEEPVSPVLDIRNS